MLFYTKYIIFKLLFSSIISYLYFPLYSDNNNFTSSDTPKELIEKLIDPKLYILINIGSENTKVKAYLVLNREEFMIAGNSIINHQYNESNSKTYKCITCASQDFYYGSYSQGILSTEDFNIKNDKNETNTFHNIKFILGTKSSYPEPPEGFIGLHLPFYDSNIDYNLIISLKKANAINSYNWHLNFDNEYKLIVDGFPHDLNNKNYNSEKFISTNALNGGYYIVWSLEFKDIYYNNLKNSISFEAKKIANIQFDYGLISAPDEVRIFLEKNFFEEYYKKNICFKENLGSYKENFIYCKNIKEFDFKKFNIIYFKSIHLNITFELTYKDLFYFKEDYVYFLLLFKGTSWIFGELFLKKYYLVFNQEKKTIGYYEGIEIEKSNKEYEKNNKFEFKINFTNILLILILISIIVVGIILYAKKGKRKNRANEMDDNYDYTSAINDDQDDKKKILDK